MKSWVDSRIQYLFKVTHESQWYSMNLFVIIALTIFFSFQLQKLHFNYDIEGFFSNNDPEVKLYSDFKSQFGNENNALLVGIESGSGIFNKSFLTDIDTLTHLINELKNVENVVSPTNLKEYVKMPIGGFHAIPLIHLERPELYSSDSTKISGIERYAGLFSMKSSSVSLILELKDGMSRKENEVFLKGMNDILNLSIFNFRAYHLAGRIQTQHYYVKTMEREMLIFSLLGVLLFSVAIWTIFKNIQYVLIPLLIILIVLVWVFGLLAYMNLAVDLMTTILPTLIFVLGTSISIHFLSKFYKIYSRTKDKSYAVKEAFMTTSIPNILISITTAAGLASLYLIPIASIQRFGLLSAGGIILSICLSLVLIPGLIRLMPIKAGILKKRRDKIHRLSLLFILSIFGNGSKRITLVYSLIGIIGAIGISFTTINNYFLDDLSDESVLKQDLLFFENQFSGIRPFELTVEPKNNGTDLFDHSNMLMLDTLESLLRTQYHLGLVYSPIVVLKTLNQSIHGGNKKFHEIPKDGKDYRRLIRQAKKYHIFDKADKLLGSNGRMTRISGRIADQGRLYYQDKNAKLKEALSNNLYLEAHLTGVAYLIDNSNANITESFILGLTIVFAVVLILILLYTNSVQVTLIALVVNVMPLVVCGAIMGYFGIPLKISTALIFTIVLGISVDDTIHYLHHFLSLREDYNLKTAIKLSLLDMTRPILFTSIVLFSGFMIFSLSSFESIQVLGWMTGLALIVAMITDLLLLPVLLVWFSKEPAKSTR